MRRKLHRIYCIIFHLTVISCVLLLSYYLISIDETIGVSTGKKMIVVSLLKEDYRTPNVGAIFSMGGQRLEIKSQMRPAQGARDLLRNAAPDDSDEDF